MDALIAIVTWYPLFGVPAGLGWLAVWVSAGHKRIDLQAGDRALLVVPWLVLNLASLVFPAGKTLANLVEVVALAAAVPAALVLRVALGRVPDQALAARRIALLVSGLGALLWVLVPRIPA